MNKEISAFFATLLAALAVFVTERITYVSTSRSPLEWLILLMAMYIGIYIGLSYRDKSKTNKKSRK